MCWGGKFHTSSLNLHRNCQIFLITFLYSIQFAYTTYSGSSFSDKGHCTINLVFLGKPEVQFNNTRPSSLKMLNYWQNLYIFQVESRHEYFTTSYINAGTFLHWKMHNAQIQLIFVGVREPSMQCIRNLFLVQIDWTKC